MQLQESAFLFRLVILFDTEPIDSSDLLHSASLLGYSDVSALGYCVEKKVTLIVPALED